MPAWEYCVIHTWEEPKYNSWSGKIKEYTMHAILTYLKPDPEQATTQEIKDVGAALAQLGVEGWELISVTSQILALERQTAGVRGTSSGLTYTLKRPLHSKSDA